MHERVDGASSPGGHSGERPRPILCKKRGKEKEKKREKKREKKKKEKTKEKKGESGTGERRRRE